ncbi:ester cyclase [Algoriphagus limi]|uniref:Ester cyclase n=1 Tax=Algoriphagus limi TaxID=2975273 RepID=A0ABT2G7Q7_9BACT|nr:ester cyclase [Algoriphagus limi]MCS5491308.1 ester cyclase [Algoriphagus limi]
MKNLILLLSIGLFMTSCQQESRYTQSSPEIDAIKMLLAETAAGNFDAQREYYAENAQIFYNATEDNPISLNDLITQQKEDMNTFSNVSVTVTDDAIEMVKTDEGETWVNCWGTWKATHTASGKSFEIPFHETFQFENGKIVKDYGYWDTSQILLAIMEFEKSQMETVDSDMNE